MAHNTRIQADAFYVPAVTLPSSWWQTLDTNQAKSINGSLGGGTWTPTGAINMSGAGMWCAGPWTMGTQMLATSFAGTRFTHNDSDYFQLKAGHTGSSRTLITDCGRFLDISTYDGYIEYDNTTSGADNQVGANGAQAASSRLAVPVRVHDGATLTQGVFSFQVGQAHANVPTIPTVRMVKVDAAGVVTPLRTISTYGNGWEPIVGFIPANGAAWFNGGAAQTGTYSLGAGEVIDQSRYAYMAEIQDETGPNAEAGNIFLSVACSFTTIVDMRPQ